MCVSLAIRPLRLRMDYDEAIMTIEIMSRMLQKNAFCDAQGNVIFIFTGLRQEI